MVKEKDISSLHLVKAIIKALEDKKGLDIVYVDFSSGRNTIAKYFVICHGSSNVHVDTLADGVIRDVSRETGSKPWNKEGFDNAEWILLDYADVVVHVFQESTRQFYNLEGLWADMKIIKVQESQ